MQLEIYLTSNLLGLVCTRRPERTHERVKTHKTNIIFQHPLSTRHCRYNLTNQEDETNTFYLPNNFSAVFEALRLSCNCFLSSLAVFRKSCSIYTSSFTHLLVIHANFTLYRCSPQCLRRTFGKKATQLTLFYCCCLMKLLLDKQGKCWKSFILWLIHGARAFAAERRDPGYSPHSCPFRFRWASYRSAVVCITTV